MSTRSYAIAAAAVVIVGLAATGYAVMRDPGGDPFADCRRGQVAGGAASIGGPFTLTAADGSRVTEVQAITRPTLVYFGYGFCPDICPTDLSRNALAAQTLKERGIDVGQVFVSIDPARDTPEAVGAFTGAIDPGHPRPDRQRGGRRGRGQGLQGLLPQGRRRPRVLPHGPFDLHLPDGAGHGLSRVLPLGRDAGGGRRFGGMLCGETVTERDDAGERARGDSVSATLTSEEDIGPDRSLLILDDDEPFLRRLSRAMEKRGFEVTAANSVDSGAEAVRRHPPAYAVVDLRLLDGNGLTIVEQIREKRPDARIVVLTGYGAIASAVAAVKMGATDYLSKPADANDITGALLARGDDRPEPPENPMSADRVRWEHIQRIYELCDRNVSETARRLNMHRRTLQRILAKRSPK